MQNSFSPDDIAIMASVLDEACQRLNSVDEKARELLAARIITHATLGERDFDTLLSVALGGAEAGFAA